MISESAGRTQEIGRELGKRLRKGTVVSLRGSLGAGKTVLAKGIAEALGISEAIVSPTFTIVQEYDGERMRMYHLDLYRIANSASALAFGVDEFLDDPDSIALVEWPARIADILPPGTLRVEIVHLSEQERRIVVRG